MLLPKIVWAFASLFPCALQWQLGHVQICTLTQTHASIPPLSFLQAGCPSCCPTNSVKAVLTLHDYFIVNCHRCSLFQLRVKKVAIFVLCHIILLFNLAMLINYCNLPAGVVCSIHGSWGDNRFRECWTSGWHLESGLRSHWNGYRQGNSNNNWYLRHVIIDGGSK